MSENIKVASAVHGIAPRSDALLRLGGDVERGRASRDEFESALDEETAHWISIQSEAGITFPENGKLRWSDHLRPIVNATEGFAPDVNQAPVTRWFATNTFYRQPTILGELRFDAAKYEEQVGAPGSNISLLAPFSFNEVCDRQFSAQSIDAVNELYDQFAAYLLQQGTRRLILEEPADSQPFDSEPIEHAVRLADNNPGLQLAYLQTGNSVTIVPRRLPENLDVRFDTTSLKQIRHIPPSYRPNLSGHELWQPIVDSDNTLEDTFDAANWPLDILRDLRPAAIILTHTVDLERLPLVYAQDKVRRLGAFAAALTNHLEQGEV